MNDDDGVLGIIDPSWSKRFNVDFIQNEVKEETKLYFKEREYIPEDGYQMAQELSKIIRDKLIKSKKIPRYKIAAQVFLGQKKDQKISINIKGYWDNYVDNYAFYTYETDNFYCTVIVYGFYTD